MKNNLPSLTYHYEKNQHKEIGFKKTIYHPQYKALKHCLYPSRKIRNYTTGELWYVAALALFLASF